MKTPSEVIIIQTEDQENKPPSKNTTSTHNMKYSFEKDEQQESEGVKGDDDDSIVDELDYEKKIRAALGLNAAELDYLFDDDEKKEEKEHNDDDDEDDLAVSSDDEDDEGQDHFEHGYYGQSAGLSFTSDSVSSFRRKLLQEQQAASTTQPPSQQQPSDEEIDDHSASIIASSPSFSSSISSSPNKASTRRHRTTSNTSFSSFILDDWNEKLLQKQQNQQQATPSRLLSKLQQIQEKQSQKTSSPETKTTDSTSSSPMPASKTKWNLQSLYQNTPSKLAANMPSSQTTAPQKEAMRGASLFPKSAPPKTEPIGNSTATPHKPFTSRLQIPSSVVKQVPSAIKAASLAPEIASSFKHRPQHLNRSRINKDESLLYLRSAVNGTGDMKGSPSSASDLLVDDDWLTSPNGSPTNIHLQSTTPAHAASAPSGHKEDSMQRLQQQYLEEKERRMELQAQVETLQKQHTTASPRHETVQRLQSFNEELEAKHQRELKVSSDQLDALNAKYKALKEQHEKMERYQKSLEDTNAKYQNLEAKSKKELQTLEEKYQGTSLELQVVAEQLKDTNDKYEDLEERHKEEKHDFATQLEKADEKYKMLMKTSEAEKQKLLEEFESATKQKMEEETKPLKDQLTTVTEKHDGLQLSLNELTDELSGANLKFQELLTRHRQETNSFTEQLKLAQDAHQATTEELATTKQRCQDLEQALRWKDKDQDVEDYYVQQLEIANARCDELVKEMHDMKEESTDNNKKKGEIVEYYIEQLEIADKKYQELEEKYSRENQEWQALLEAEMNSKQSNQIASVADNRSTQSSSEDQDAPESEKEDYHEIEDKPTEEKNSSCASSLAEEEERMMAVPFDEDNQLSPIPKRLSELHQKVFGGLAGQDDHDNPKSNDPSLDYQSSSDQHYPEDERTKDNASMEKLDGLLQELNQMNVERATLLDEIHHQSVERAEPPVVSTTNFVQTSTSPSVYRSGEEGEEKDAEDTDNQLALFDEANISKDDSSAMLDQTISLLVRTLRFHIGKIFYVSVASSSNFFLYCSPPQHNLKDLMDGQGDGEEASDKESSIMGQLEALSELMNDDSTKASASETILAFIEQESRSRRSANESQLAMYEGPTGTPCSDELVLGTSNVNTSELETSMLNKSSESLEQRAQQSQFHDDVGGNSNNPWAQLVEELRRKIRFLEHDRTELARITQVMLSLERESHSAKLEAAVATTKRESMEQFQRYKQHVNQQMKTLYSSLCLTCQRRIYAAT